MKKLKIWAFLGNPLRRMSPWIAPRSSILREVILEVFKWQGAGTKKRQSVCTEKGMEGEADKSRTSLPFYVLWVSDAELTIINPPF